MQTPLVQQLIALLEPLAPGHGLELVNVEVAGAGRHQVVRVYLDREGGIDIDAIAEANSWISEVLDTVPRLNGPYTLEVSSPGIERVLRTRRDFERFSGERVLVQSAKPIGGRSKFTGALVGLQGDEVVIEVEGTEYRVPFDSIERARIKADFGTIGEGSGKQS